MRPRIVLDTNVLVSGLFWSGAPTSIIRLLEQNQTHLVVTPAIVREYTRVLSRSEFAPRIVRLGITVDDLLIELTERAVIYQDSVSPIRIPDDPSDEKFLAAALSGGADVIVTGDRHLLELQTKIGLDILTPVKFLNRYQ